MFRKNRPWQRFHSGRCRKRFCDLRRRRRTAAKRNRSAHNASPTHFRRVSCRQYIEVGSIRKALIALAQTKPEVFQGLLAAPGRQAIELAG
jgi:hypothetical protein